MEVVEMTTGYSEVATDPTVHRLIAALVVLHDSPLLEGFREARLQQLLTRPDPLTPPPAGEWMRETRAGHPAGPWHLSSGIAEQSTGGLIHGWMQVIPACNRRYSITARFGPNDSQPTIETQDAATVADGICARCVAISDGKAKAANWKGDR